MKTQDFFLLALVLFILLSFGPTNPSVAVNPLYAQLESEGMVAMHYNDHTYEMTPVPENTEPTPQPASVICRCPSNCGKENCNCQSSGVGCKPETKAVEEVSKEPVLVQQVLFFTMKNCPPCKKWKDVDKKILVDAGWTVDTGPRNIIREVDIDENPELWAKYSQDNSVPQFVLLNNGKVISSYIGYRDYLTVSRMLKSP